MYQSGDYVYLADLPRPFLCRVTDAESFSVGTDRSQMLELAPLEGPWPVGTMLVRLDHCVKPCDVRSHWRAPMSRAARHEGSSPARSDLRHVAA
jgi:hypothetical protein